MVIRSPYLLVEDGAQCPRRYGPDRVQKTRISCPLLFSRGNTWSSFDSGSDFWIQPYGTIRVRSKPNNPFPEKVFYLQFNILPHSGATDRLDSIITLRIEFSGLKNFSKWSTTLKIWTISPTSETYKSTPISRTIFFHPSSSPREDTAHPLAINSDYWAKLFYIISSASHILPKSVRQN